MRLFGLKRLKKGKNKKINKHKKIKDKNERINPKSKEKYYQKQQLNNKQQKQRLFFNPVCSVQNETNNFCPLKIKEQQKDIDFNNILQEEEIIVSFLVVEIHEKYYQSIKTILHRCSQIWKQMSSSIAEAVMQMKNYGNVIIADDKEEEQFQESMVQEEWEQQKQNSKIEQQKQDRKHKGQQRNTKNKEYKQDRNNIEQKQDINNKKKKQNKKNKNKKQNDENKEQKQKQIKKHEEQVSDEDSVLSVLAILRSSCKVAKSVHKQAADWAPQKCKRLIPQCWVMVNERLPNLPAFAVESMHSVLKKDLVSLPGYLLNASEVQVQKNCQTPILQSLIFSKFEDYEMCTRGVWWLGENVPSTKKQVQMKALYYILTGAQYLKGVDRIKLYLQQ